MKVSIERVAGIFWALSLGLIALFAFFAALGLVALGDVVWLTVIVVALALMSTIHFIRVRRALGHSDHRHDELARSVHAMRERRGF